jgi:hypothetical protein
MASFSDTNFNVTEAKSSKKRVTFSRDVTQQGPHPSLAGHDGACADEHKSLNKSTEPSSLSA